MSGQITILGVNAVYFSTQNGQPIPRLKIMCKILAILLRHRLLGKNVGLNSVGLKDSVRDVIPLYSEHHENILSLSLKASKHKLASLLNFLRCDLIHSSLYKIREN
jgi:hypothetical protein